AQIAVAQQDDLRKFGTADCRLDLVGFYVAHRYRTQDDFVSLLDAVGRTDLNWAAGTVINAQALRDQIVHGDAGRSGIHKEFNGHPVNSARRDVVPAVSTGDTHHGVLRTNKAGGE